MNTVIVGGPHSGVGKTLASELAIAALSDHRVGAIKLTVADGERDPAHDHGSALAAVAATGICGRGASCGVCETVSVKIPYRLITNAGAIAKPGTDTCRLLHAGALAVAWVIALRSAAPKALEKAMTCLENAGAQIVVIEGTTALEWIRPDFSALIGTDPGKKWKQVAVQHANRCSIVLRNVMPVAPGSIAAPGEFWAAKPMECDLTDSSNPGTVEFVRRLKARLTPLARPRSAAR